MKKMIILGIVAALLVVVGVNTTGKKVADTVPPGPIGSSASI